LFGTRQRNGNYLGRFDQSRWSIAKPEFLHGLLRSGIEPLDEIGAFPVPELTRLMRQIRDKSLAIPVQLAAIAGHYSQKQLIDNTYKSFILSFLSICGIQAHNLKAGRSNSAPATSNTEAPEANPSGAFCVLCAQIAGCDICSSG
jgi:hypothetical protein